MRLLLFSWFSCPGLSRSDTNFFTPPDVHLASTSLHRRAPHFARTRNLLGSETPKTARSAVTIRAFAGRTTNDDPARAPPPPPGSRLWKQPDREATRPDDGRTHRRRSR